MTYNCFSLSSLKYTVYSLPAAICIMGARGYATVLLYLGRQQEEEQERIQKQVAGRLGRVFFWSKVFAAFKDLSKQRLKGRNSSQEPLFACLKQYTYKEEGGYCISR